MKILKTIGLVFLGLLCFGIAIQCLKGGVALITSLVNKSEANNSIALLGQFSADIFFLFLYIAGIRALLKSLKKKHPEVSGM